MRNLNGFNFETWYTSKNTFTFLSQYSEMSWQWTPENLKNMFLKLSWKEMCGFSKLQSCIDNAFHKYNIFTHCVGYFSHKSSNLDPGSKCFKSQSENLLFTGFLWFTSVPPSKCRIYLHTGLWSPSCLHLWTFFINLSAEIQH